MQQIDQLINISNPRLQLTECIDSLGSGSMPTRYAYCPLIIVPEPGSRHFFLKVGYVSFELVQVKDTSEADQ